MRSAPRGMEELVKERFRLWQQVVLAGDMVRGSVVVLRRPCSYANCRLCREGRRHPANYLSMSVQGKTRLIYLPKAWVEEARQWTAEWRRVHGLLLRLSQVNAEVLRLLSRRGTTGRRKERE